MHRITNKSGALHSLTKEVEYMHRITKEVEYLHRMTTESGAFAQDKITSGVQLVVLVSLAPQYIKASEQECQRLLFPPSEERFSLSPRSESPLSLQVRSPAHQLGTAVLSKDQSPSQKQVSYQEYK